MSDLITCRKCDGGRVPVGIRTATREMARDAGDPQLEGWPVETIYAVCDCCDGEWWDCWNCSGEPPSEAQS